MFVSRIEAESTTLAEALERYALDAAPKKKDAYHDTLRCRRLNKRPLAGKALAAIRGKDIAAFIRERQDEGVGANMIRSTSPCSPTCSTPLARPRGMESLTNPVDLVKGQRPKLPGGRDRRSVGDEQARLLAAGQAYGAGPHAGIGIANIITLAIETTMRRGEIAAMRWEHLDRTLPMRGDNEARVLLIPETKTGTPRRVPLSTGALGVLDQLPRRIDDRVCS